MFLFLKGFSQDSPGQFVPWKLTAISGEARIRGVYQESETKNDNYLFMQKNSYLTGVFMLRTKSFFIHPNFVIVNLNATYSPETSRNYYLGIPDYAEKNNTEGLDFSALFFSKKRLNLTTNGSISTNIQNIENINVIKTKSRQYGAIIAYSNKFLPFSVGYTQQKSEQTTVGSDRKFNFDSRTIEASTKKSFFSSDNNSLAYWHIENISTQPDTTSINIQPLSSMTTYDNFELIDDIPLDSKRNYMFNSSISNSNGRGTYNLKTLYANESLNLKLPKNFTFSNIYNLGITQQDLNKINTQGFRSGLNHQLFQSLNSNLFFEHNQTTQTDYNEQRNKIGIDFRYVKQIPNGKLTLLYSYYTEFQQVVTPPTTLKMIHQEYILSDNELVLFTKQNVNIQSVIVKNAAGNIIYQNNLDYVLVDKSPYLEIVRVPGGLIANGAPVFIDYTAEQAGLYKYDMNNNSFSTDLSLFKNVFNVYYRFSTQEYHNQSLMQNLVLNYFTRHVGGARLNFSFVKSGAEYEYYKSSIIPYQREKVFINLQKMYKNVFFTLNGNLQNYQMASENTNRQDMDVSGKIAYSIFKNVQLSFDLMYRNMRGAGVNLDLTTSKLEITSNINKLFFSVGAEVYWNQTVNNITNFKGLYLQLKRSF